MRLQGTQQGRQLSFDDLVEHATWVLEDIRRHPEKRPDLEKKFDHNRRVSPLGIRKIQSRKTERYVRARELVVSGMAPKEAAAELGCSPRTIQRAMAEAKSATNPITTPHPDDLMPEIFNLESSRVRKSDGVCRSDWPADTLASTFEANTGQALTNAQAAQLARWEAQIGDGEEIVDVVRLMVHARGKRNPWRYVASKAPGYIGNPESRHDLERMATPRAIEYSRYAADPRAYLATCIRNEARLYA